MTVVQDGAPGAGLLPEAGDGAAAGVGSSTPSQYVRFPPRVQVFWLPAESVTVIAVKLPFTGADRAMETGTFTMVPCAISGTPLSRLIDPEPSALSAVHDDHVIPVRAWVPSRDVWVVDGFTAN